MRYARGCRCGFDVVQVFAITSRPAKPDAQGAKQASDGELRRMADRIKACWRT